MLNGEVANTRISLLLKINTYRLILPVLCEEQEVAMDDQEDICQHQQMMCIPEGIEPGQIVERPW